MLHISTMYCMGISACKFKGLVASGPKVLCFGHQANNFIYAVKKRLHMYVRCRYFKEIDATAPKVLCFGHLANTLCTGIDCVACIQVA